MGKLRALIAAAGRGTRAGLPYPKTLYPVRGIPILLRLLYELEPFDSEPTVIVSPSGFDLVSHCLNMADVNAHLVVQPEPLGMGDAVLHFSESPAYSTADHVLLAWGDIPFIQFATVERLVQIHLTSDNDFTFATRFVGSAYTMVSRDPTGQVLGVVETREQGVTKPEAGERDIGLFVFRKEPMLEVLRGDLPGKYGRTTGEHGFLYAIEHLVRRGYRVDALPVAQKQDLISLNSLGDLDGIDSIIDSCR